jgi:hypothetical protein
MRFTARLFAVVALLPILPLNLFAKCPIAANGTLDIKTPMGNLIVETSGTDSVEIEVSNKLLVVNETCGEPVRITATVPQEWNAGIPDWKIRVPKGVSLDLTTNAGNIRIPHTDGSETRLRTSSGTIITGNIKGNALIVTQANQVQAGNIGGNAELRSNGGKLTVGDVGGNAEFYTVGGSIEAKVVQGKVTANTGTGGGAITIWQSNGNVVAETREGDIVSQFIRGSFDGHTESGNIRIERVGSSVRAYTGMGDIYFRLVPEKPQADIEVKVASGLGNITMFIPEAIKATVDAMVERPAYKVKQIVSEIPIKRQLLVAPVTSLRSLVPGGPERELGTMNGGGGSRFDVRTSQGKIEIKIWKGN